MIPALPPRIQDSESNPAPAICRWRSRLHFPCVALAAVLSLPVLSEAAVSNVIVWPVARTANQLDITRMAQPTSASGMQLWWKCDSGANVGWDATGNVRHGKLKGTVAGIFVDDPWGAPHTVASGFNAPFCYMVVNPGLAPTADRTYEFWVRNPKFANGNAVLFSLLRSETGEVRTAQSPDIMRLWIESNGALRMADRGNGLQTPVTGTLSWDTDKWYQIAVVCDYSSATGTTNVKVYRAERNGGAYPAALLNYTSAPAGTQNWLAIGGHEASYQTGERANTGKEGCIGLDGNGTDPAVTPEMYGYVGTDPNLDTAAWRRACAVLSAHGRGTLTLTAGKTYWVGMERIVNDSDPTNRWYEHDQMGWVVGARNGPVTVNGNGATVKLVPGQHFGGYSPVDGTLANRTVNTTQADRDEYKIYRDYASDPGNILHFEDCLDVHVTNIKLHGNLETQHWGGLYADKGYQNRQSGLYLKNNDAVLVDGGVQCLYNGLDGIGILNEDLDETSPLRTVEIRNVSCTYNGRQGLSYNCGNHLEIYDSDFSYTGKKYAQNITTKKNYPGAGVDVEPFDRYMRAGALIENCTFFDNREVGLLLTGASPVIVRDCILFQSTDGRAVYLQGGPRYPDEDHFFIRSSIYGQVYNNAGNRARFEECSFIQANNAYYGPPINANVPVKDRPAIESIETAGSILLDTCTINITQNNGVHPVSGNATVTRSAFAFKTVVENSVVHHGNKRAGLAAKEASILKNSFIRNTRFTESGFVLGDTYFVDDGSTDTQSIIGPDVRMEGPTPSSDHFISWSSTAGSRPFASPGNVTATPNTWKVLTPNVGANEMGVSTTATYSVIDNPFTPANDPNPFNNPADPGNTRLFDGDSPDDWNHTAGLNWLDQAIDINLHATYNVRSVKIRMKHSMTQRPKRIWVHVGNGSTWTAMGLLRPNERDNTTNPDTWYHVTLPATLSGSHVRLVFENEGAWGWYINEVKVYGY